MTTITSLNRNNISQLLSKAVTNQNKAKFSQNKFVSSVDNVSVNQAKDNFTKLPSQTDYAEQLFKTMASQGLPKSVLETHSSEEAEFIRNMLGIIYRDAEPEDLPKFDKVFREFVKSNDKFTKDEKVASELGFLFHKYGKSALSKLRDDYVQHCRDAWNYHHDTHGGTATDEDIFTLAINACYQLTDFNINNVTDPKQSWATIVTHGANFAGSCASLSKALNFYDEVQAAHPAAEPQLNPIPQKASSQPTQGQQPSAADTTTFSYPAGQGYGSVTFNNTNSGGNGVSNVDGNSHHRAPASAMDFGIALLNTPDDQLGNEKARLVEKFMDLYWGRAQNGGRDKFSDHVEKVVKSEPPLVPFIATLPAPPIFHAVEEVVVAPARQFASVNLSEAQPAVNQALASTATGNETLIDNTILTPERQQVFSHTVDTSNNLHNAATQVAQALSALLTEVDAVDETQSRGQNALSGSVVPLAAEPEQKLQSAMIKTVEPTKNVGRSNHSVRQLIGKFEALNMQHQTPRENESNRLASTKTERTNLDSGFAKPNAAVAVFQPLKLVNSNFNQDMSVKEIPVYTTQRTIDPFSRRSLDLKHLVHVFNRQSVNQEIQELDSDLVSNL